MNLRPQSIGVVLFGLLWGWHLNSAMGGQGFLIRGVSQCTESNLASSVPGSAVGFLVACRDDCLVSAQLYKNEEVYSLAKSGNHRVIVIESDLLAGKPFDPSSSRRFHEAIETQQELVDSFESRLDAAELPSFRYLALPVLLSSRWLGIRRDVMESALVDDKSELVTAAGRLVATGIGGIESMEFVQSATDRVNASGELLLKDIAFAPFESGLQEIRHTFSFAPKRQANVLGPFYCKASTSFVNEKQSWRVAFHIDVEEVAGRDAASRFIDAFLKKLPDGISVVSRSEVKTVLHDGTQKIAIDYDSLAASKRATFSIGRTLGGWLYPMLLMLIAGIAGIVLWRRRK